MTMHAQATEAPGPLRTAGCLILAPVDSFQSAEAHGAVPGLLESSLDFLLSGFLPMVAMTIELWVDLIWPSLTAE